jgi:hypothetical protein
MKTLIALTVIGMAMSSTAFADGFNCYSAPADHLHVLIQDHVNAANGTRKAAVVVITDTAPSDGVYTLMSSTTITQSGADWSTNASDATIKDNAQIGDLALSDVVQAEVSIPSFSFNVSHKDSSGYEGLLTLSTASQAIAQEVALSCVYNTKN